MGSRRYAWNFNCVQVRGLKFFEKKHPDCHVFKKCPKCWWQSHWGFLACSSSWQACLFSLFRGELGWKFWGWKGLNQGTGHVTKTIHPRVLVEVCRDQARCEQNNNGCDPCKHWNCSGTSILRRQKEIPVPCRFGQMQHIPLEMLLPNANTSYCLLQMMQFSTHLTPWMYHSFWQARQKLGRVPLFPPYLFSTCISGHPRLQLYMYTCSWPEWSTSEQAGNRRFFFGCFWCSWQFGRHFGYLLVWGRSLKVQSSLHLSSLSRDTRVEPSQNF